MRPLINENTKIVENKKWYFLLPLVILVVAVISLFIYKGTTGDSLNLGMDFAGGYTININLGANLTEENKEEYKDIVSDVITGLSDENGKSYGIKIDKIQTTGSGDATSLYIKYKAVGSDAEMEEINQKLIDELNKTVTRMIPAVSIVDGTVTLTYQESVKSYESIIKSLLDEGGVTYSNFTYVTNKVITFDAIDADATSIKEIASISNPYVGEAIMGDLVSGSVSSDLLWRAAIAVLVSLLLMLIYIAFRFELVSGIVAILCLMHDIIMMAALMIIFHIEFNGTIIAALITILGYSINNTIILFDRVRENVKFHANDKVSAAYVANKSVADTFVRSINTTLTTFIMIGMIGLVCAIGGIVDMVTFTLPIIFGLMLGAFSSILLAPSLWELLVRKNFDSIKPKKNKKEEKVKEVIAVD